MATLAELRARPLNYAIEDDILDAVGTTLLARQQYLKAQMAGSVELYRSTAALLAEAAKALHELEQWCDFVAEEIQQPDEFNVRDYDLEQERKEWADG